MSNQQDFLRYADQCNRMAEDGDVSGHRDALERMAHVWRQLAAEEERIAGLIRDIDKCFSAPVNSVNARLHRPLNASSTVH
jgi:hypothetical protein